jgi:hypothetical protein
MKVTLQRKRVEMKNTLMCIEVPICEVTQHAVTGTVMIQIHVTILE